MPNRRLPFALALLVLLLIVVARTTAWQQQRRDFSNDPFKGLTSDGSVRTGLFPIRATGVTTEPVRAAAEQFLSALTEEQRKKTTYPVNDDEWRDWNNIHRYARQGVNFEEMSEAQRTKAYGLLQASLSAKGLQLSRDIMRLNGYLNDLVNRPGEYSEYFYHLTVMGTPSRTQPWGWQLDGHHLIINYFVLGDQVVMTPTFMGSEPLVADGKYGKLSVLQSEQDKGLAFMQSLSEAQQARTKMQPGAKTTNYMPLAHAFRDNVVVNNVGLRANELSATQKTQLLDLAHEYVRNMDDGHARVRMEELRKHIDDTYFAWWGDVSKDAVFYYRIQSPVVLIEFDHQSPVAFPRGAGLPTRNHIHTVVRTPNGNDYGKDLLRQHYEQTKGDPSHGHMK